MELSHSQYEQPMSRFKRAARFVFDRFYTTDFQIETWRPSRQRDVGRTARRAADVQLVVASLQQTRPVTSPEASEA